MRTPIVLEMDGWARLRVGATPDYLRQFGPCINVELQAVGSAERIGELVALVDTGAAHSCVSPRLATRLAGAENGTIRQYAAGAETQDVTKFRCRLFFPEIIETEADFAVLSHLKVPHEVVVGCDILHDARLLVDFTTGNWEVHFRIR